MEVKRDFLVKFHQLGPRAVAQKAKEGPANMGGGGAHPFPPPQTLAANSTLPFPPPQAATPPPFPGRHSVSSPLVLPNLPAKVKKGGGTLKLSIGQRRREGGKGKKGSHGDYSATSCGSLRVTTEFLTGLVDLDS